MTTDQQIAFLRNIAGEPEDSAQARWSATQLLAFLNSGRRRVAELTRCFQIKDSQQTIAGTSLYSVPNDFIGFYAVEWNGNPIFPVRPEDWRFVVGDDDTLAGTALVFKYFQRKFQLYYVPPSVQTFSYDGWGYAAYLVSGGVDSDFLPPAQEAACYQASVLLKKADERNADSDLAELSDRITELKSQYRRKGPRFVRDISLGFWRTRI